MYLEPEEKRGLGGRRIWSHAWTQPLRGNCEEMTPLSHPPFFRSCGNPRQMEGTCRHERKLPHYRPEHLNDGGLDYVIICMLMKLGVEAGPGPCRIITTQMSTSSRR